MKVTIKDVKLIDNTEAILIQIYYSNKYSSQSFALKKNWHKEKHLFDNNDIPYYIVVMQIITNIDGNARKLALLNRNSPIKILSEVSNTYLQKGEIKIEYI